MAAESTCIRLTRGLVALVSPEDFSKLSRFKWCALKSKYTYYAVRADIKEGKRTLIYMHRELLKGGQQIDHVNGNGLDNRRINLRACNHSNNACNQRKTRGSSKYKGVFYNKGTKASKTKPWTAQIALNEKDYNLGSYASEEIASVVYDIAAAILHREFAKTNHVLGRKFLELLRRSL